jgi:tRNA 2-thiouridine synthesizing protein A
MHARDLKELSIAKVIDARWAACPGPLLAAKEEIGHLKVGEIIEILTVDTVARGDISAWAGKAGHEFLGFSSSEGYDRIFVRKK